MPIHYLTCMQEKKSLPQWCRVKFYLILGLCPESKLSLATGVKHFLRVYFYSMLKIVF